MGAVCDDHDNQKVTKQGNTMVTATTTNSCDLANTAQNEKRPRRLWKSFSVETAGSELGASSPGVEEVSQVSQLKYGNVVPALRLQLAEQGDSCAQVEVARELLVTVTTCTNLAVEEVASLEERAVYWLLRAAEQGHTEARSTLQVNIPVVETIIIEAK